MPRIYIEWNLDSFIKWNFSPQKYLNVWKLNYWGFNYQRFKQIDLTSGDGYSRHHQGQVSFTLSLDLRALTVSLYLCCSRSNVRGKARAL